MPAHATRVVAAIAVAAASVVQLLAARPAFAQSTKTVWDGVFTTGQAARGEGSYQKACSSCHGASLEGDAFAPPLVGEPFTGRWQDGTLGDVLLVVKTTMPEDRPATLSADVYADIVAFLLKMNSYPAGQSELGQDPAQLKDIRFTKAPRRGL